MKTMPRKGLALVLTFALLFVSMSSSAVYAETLDSIAKDETVYVNLNHDGSIKETIVVNALSIPQSGFVIDYGHYTDVKNLSSTSIPTIENGWITWPADPEKHTFYYQGYLESAELPWTFDIVYTLDGKKVQGESLAGANGALTIQIEANANEKANDYFKENYMAQISMTLSGDYAQDIEAPDGSIITVSDNKNVAFTVMPGQSETFEVSAAITDFEMSGITISLINQSSGTMSDIVGNVQGGVLTLSSSIAQLIDGTGQLKGGVTSISQGISMISGNLGTASGVMPLLSNGLSGVEGGMNDLAGGMNEIASASSEIRTALGLLDVNAYDLVNGYSIIENALERMTQSKKKLENANNSLSEQNPSMSSLVNGSETLTQGLDTLFETGIDMTKNTGALLQQAETLAAQSAENAALIGQLMPYIVGINAQAEGISVGLGNLSDGAADLNEGLQEADEGMETLYDAAMELSEVSVDLVTGIDDISGAMEPLGEGLTAYTENIGTLAANYATFDNYISDLDEGASNLYDAYNPLTVSVDDIFEAVGDIGDSLSRLDESAKQLPDVVSQIERGQEQVGTGITNASLGLTGALSEDETVTSFVASGRVAPNSVQFVIKTPTIEIPEPEVVEEEEISYTFWQKLKNLFVKEGNEG